MRYKRRISIVRDITDVDGKRGFEIIKGGKVVYRIYPTSEAEYERISLELDFEKVFIYYEENGIEYAF